MRPAASLVISPAPPLPPPAPLEVSKQIHGKADFPRSTITPKRGRPGTRALARRLTISAAQPNVLFRSVRGVIVTASNEVNDSIERVMWDASEHGRQRVGTRSFRSSVQLRTTLIAYSPRMAFFIRKRPSGATSH